MTKRIKVIIAAVVCIIIVFGLFFTFKFGMGSQSVSYAKLYDPDMAYLKTSSFKDFEDMFSREFLLRNPNYMILAGEEGKNEVKLAGASFINPSKDFSSKTYDIYKKYLADIKSFDGVNLSDNEKLTLEIMKWYLEDYIGGEKYTGFSFPINPVNGVQYVINDYMTEGFNIKNAEDANKYIEYLSGYEGIFNDCIKQMKAMEKEGIILPRGMIDETITQIDWFTMNSPKDSILYNDFFNKVSKIKEIDNKDKQKLFKSAEDIIEKSIYPAYGKAADFLKDQKQNAPKGQNSKAAGWKDYYKYSLKHYTTMDLDPVKTHEMALKRVEELKKEYFAMYAEAISKMLNVPVERVMQDPFGKDINRILYQVQAGRLKGNDLLTQYGSTIDEAKEDMKNYFNNVPDERVKVEFIPQTIRKSFFDMYIPASLDNSRAAKVYVSSPFDGISERMFTSPIFHNVYPGFHMQLNIQRSQKDICFFRKIYNFEGYDNAWGYYCENLAYENGFYKEPYDKLAYLLFQIYQTALAVIDTGVNYMGWSREQAMSYMTTNVGEGISYDIDKCFIMPGSGCAGYMGGLKLLELRDKAKLELGNKFDIKEFHDVILNNGSMPLGILEKQVQDYIDLKKGKQ